MAEVLTEGHKTNTSLLRSKFEAPRPYSGNKEETLFEKLSSALRFIMYAVAFFNNNKKHWVDSIIEELHALLPAGNQRTSQLIFLLNKMKAFNYD